MLVRPLPDFELRRGPQIESGTRPLYYHYRTRLNTARLPAQTLWLPSTTPYYPPIIFPSMFLQPRCPVCPVLPLCRTHISSLGHSNGVFQVVMAFFFKTGPLQNNPRGRSTRTIHLSPPVLFPLFSFHDQDKTTALPC